MALTMGTANSANQNITLGQPDQGARAGQTFWVGANGHVYLNTPNGVQDMGDQGTAKAYNLILNGAKEVQAPTDPTPPVAPGGPAKVLDRAQLTSLDSLLANIDTTRETNKAKAETTRKTNLKEKAEEKEREEGKYNGKKLGVLQDFAGAKTDTDLSTRDTLENLISSLSTLGLGGSRALTRQILDAANKSNRKANATQATNTRDLDVAFNEYGAANENDVKKIEDQYGYDIGEADRKYGQDRQSTLYKKADVLGNGGRDADRSAVMAEGDNLNSLITGSAFVNPSYTGETRAMATPELGDYSQDIAKYDTSNIGANLGAGALTPVGADGATGAGNLAVRAIAVNDKDLGIKKKTEAELGYGV